MAIITEEPESPKSKTNRPPSESEPRKPNRKPIPSSSDSGASPNPFIFWFYFTLSVSLVTFLFVSLSSFASPHNSKSWFLSLPNSLRQHYSKGRTIKVQTRQSESPIEVFVAENGKVSSENVVLVHGLGLSSYSYREVVRSLGSKGIRVVSIDLPGHGFSDKSMVVVEEGESGAFGKLRDVYDEIKEKGIFWAFDRIVETGQMPYEELGNRVSKREVVRALELGPQEMESVLKQVIDTMGLAPVHLVLHDSALGIGANWVSENSGSVRSITLVDTAPKLVGALPLWALDIPVVREVVLGVSFAFSRLINLCCSKGVSVSDADAYRFLLRGRDGRRAVVGMAKKMNCSFDLAEWGATDGLKGVPMQVLWSSNWSEEWSKEGQRVAQALPQAKFLMHSGGRWPQVYGYKCSAFS